MKSKKRPPKITVRFNIHRSKWKRGSGWGSRLLTHSGQQCCLGFFAAACSVSRRDMRDVPTLDELRDPMTDKRLPVDPGAKAAFDRVRRREGKFIDVNDEKMPAREREERLTELFRSCGVAVRFRG